MCLLTALVKLVEERGNLREVKEFFSPSLHGWGVNDPPMQGGGGRCEAEPTESGGRTCREVRAVGAGRRAWLRAPHAGGR